MKVLIIGIAGTGKSFLVERLKEMGVNAIDVDFTKLAKFVDENGNQVAYDPNGGRNWWASHYYVFNLKLLKDLLKENDNAYVFCNVYGKPGERNGSFDVIGLFDKTYYLLAPKELLAKRLTGRTNNIFGKHPDELHKVLEYKDEMDENAKKLGIPIIDATLPVETMIKIIIS